ncbi:MAG: hypothetical protein K2I64_05070 [Muribaculaceae bacterium]|nr:hypothetical protein [Muribaculaceae bacterium]
MSTYKGKPTLVEKPIEDLYQRLCDFDNLREALSRVPADKLEQAGEITIADGQLSISTPVGNVAFEVVEVEPPVRIVYGPVTATPVPVSIAVNLKAVSPETTEVAATIDIELPMMLRTFVGSKLQDAVDGFGQMIAMLCK